MFSGGFFRASSDDALGSTAGTTAVGPSAALELVNNIDIPSGETLTLSGTGIGGNGGALRSFGTNSWAGNIILVASARINSDDELLTLSGNISTSGSLKNLTFGGAGNVIANGVIGADDTPDDIQLAKDGTGTLTLAAANTYTGTTTITDGRLRLGASNVIPDTSNVVLNGGTLATGGNSDTVGSLTVSVPVGVTGNVIDMGDGASQLTFASIASWDGPVSGLELDGTINSAGGTDKTALHRHRNPSRQCAILLELWIHRDWFWWSVCSGWRRW